MVYRWVQLQRDEPALAPAQTQNQAKRTTQSMAPRHLAWLFLRDPEHLEKQEEQALSFLRKTPNVEMAYGIAQQLVKMVK